MEKGRPKRAHKAVESDCTVPPALPAESLTGLVLHQDADAADQIREYVEWQAADERVAHAEKVNEEFVVGRRHDCWDVHTDKGQYWVITEPTNLYSKALFPSLDYTISFHVGLAARMMSQRTPGVEPLEQMTMPDAWRRWEQAGEVLNEAEEAEDFQAVGMRCRECLIVMVRTLSLPEMVPAGELPPKHADVVHWAERIADHIAHGSSAKEVRGYLKATSKAGWEMVNWLTHARNATRADAMLAHDVTQHVLATFGTASFRHRQGIPDRCEACGSYRVGLWSPEPGEPIRPRCHVCGWLKPERLDG